MKKNYYEMMLLFFIAFITSTNSAKAQGLDIKTSSNVWVSNSTLLYLGGNLTNAGNMTFNSDAVFFTKPGITSSGTVKYNRDLKTDGWYLVSAPFSGETYNNAYVTANNLASGTGNNRALAPYNRLTNRWNYLQAGTTMTVPNGKGMQVKKASITSPGVNNIAFTGEVNVADVSVGIKQEHPLGYELLGNPFATYFDVDSFLNDVKSDLPSSSLEVWIFDTGSPKTLLQGIFGQNVAYYTVINLASSYKLAPTQSFFIKLNQGVDKNIDLKLSYRQASSSNANVFSKEEKYNFKLYLSDGDYERYSNFYFFNKPEITKGYDRGYDGEIFDGTPNGKLDIFSKLVENNSKESKKYQIQSLPIADANNIIIPIGVKSFSGKELTFTLDKINYSENFEFYLEDVVTNTITKIDDDNASYKVTLNEDLDGFGRFYLHSSPSSVLNTENIAFDKISIFKSDNLTLTINGLIDGNKNQVRLFNILGARVLSTNFVASGTKEIRLPKLSTGMYIVELENESGKLNKKIIIE